MDRDNYRRGLLGAFVLGFGFSAVLDVLVLHHVLQLHHLLSNVYPTGTASGLRTNLRADGLFSLGMLFAMGLGGGILWRAERRSRDPLPVRPLTGAGVFGLGLFNLFDVVVNHTLFGLHNATDGPGYYDPHWAVVSLLVIAAGLLVYRSETDGRTAPRADD